MKINGDGLCPKCKHFEHDCGDGEIVGCHETCLHPDSEITDRFYESIMDDEDIMECEGFEEY